jgi:protein TonB
VAEPVTSETVKMQEEPVETAAAERVEVVEARKPDPKPVETAKPKQEEKAKPVEKKAETPKKPAKEEKKQATKKTDEGKKAAEKAQAKSRKSGSGGQNETDSRRGQADGQEKGDNRQASRGGSKNGKVGNAAVTNYPGKVRSKLARAARSIRMKKSGEVVVAFSVNASGGVSSARIQSSSGVSEIDQAALQALRKAAPFPPIPENAGRSSWQFSVPLAFSRR